MKSSNYERELKNILEGEQKTLLNVTKRCSLIERVNYFKIKEKPFVVVRAAGSFGVDLIAARGDISFLIEVKTSSEKRLHFSSKAGKLQEQAEYLKKLCEKTKNLPIYAFRAKNQQGDSWRMFTIELDGLEGRNSILYKRLSKLKKSKEGNFVMEWEKGMPLSDFISYICSTKL